MALNQLFCSDFEMKHFLKENYAFKGHIFICKGWQEYKQAVTAPNSSFSPVSFLCSFTIPTSYFEQTYTVFSHEG